MVQVVEAMALSLGERVEPRQMSMEYRFQHLEVTYAEVKAQSSRENLTTQNANSLAANALATTCGTLFDHGKEVRRR